MSLTRSLSVVLVAAALLSCGTHSSRYSRKQAQKTLMKLETPGLVVGEFSVTKVSDGDTIRVEGLDSSLRLLGIDTEETFDHYPAQRKQYESDGWPAYTKEVRGDSKRPVKFATPMGDEAWHYAERFFEGADKVRIERDHPSEIRDAYNRYLAYVFVKKNGTWVNYNVECVRDGMAPYFAKYGQSRRFHAEFVKAQEEARAAKRGIWAPGVMSYPDYDERLAWWNARGEFVTQFRKDGDGKDNYIDISHWDATQKLEELVGKEVHLLGVVGDVRIGEKGPTRVELARSRFGGFPLVFFDRDVFTQSGIGAWGGEYVIATGTPTMYENPHTHKKQVQIVIDRAAQITLSPVPGLQIPTSSPAP